jgi:Family of unknown function (DUF6497)
MRLRLALAAGLILALGAGAVWLRPGAAPPPPEGAIAVPSGQIVTLQDVVGNVAGPAGLTTRFRFVAPGIAGDVTLGAAQVDMEALCNDYALPRVVEFGPTPAQIVISLADIAVPFGEAAPEATQYFEAYSIQNGVCIWDVF